LRAIHRQHSQACARREADALVDSLHELKLAESAKLLAMGIEDGLSYYCFPQEHWSRLRTSNPVNRLTRQLHARAGGGLASVDPNAELVRISSWLRDITVRSRLARFPNMQRLRAAASLASEYPSVEAHVASL
jgi:putative transposase